MDSKLLTQNEIIADEVINEFAKEVEDLKQEFKRRLEIIKHLTNIQGNNGNWNYDEYMHGLHSGMEFCLSILEDREPKYKDAPEKWLRDIKSNLTVPETLESISERVDIGGSNG